MRRLALALALAGCAATAAAIPTPAVAASSYCSPTGDHCYSAQRRNGVVRLYFGTFALRGRIRICVTPPRGDRECKLFRLRGRRGLFEVDAKWSAHFTNRGKGTYRVRFRLPDGGALGPAVRFRRR